MALFFILSYVFSMPFAIAKLTKAELTKEAWRRQCAAAGISKIDLGAGGGVS